MYFLIILKKGKGKKSSDKEPPPNPQLLALKKLLIQLTSSYKTRGTNESMLCYGA